MAVASVRRPHVDAVSAAARRVVTAALAVALTAVTGGAVLAAGWSAGQAVAVLIGVLGAVSAALVTLLRPPRLAGIALVPVLFVAGVVLPTIGSAPVPAGSHAGALVSTYARAVLTGLGGNAQWTFNVGLGSLLWACGAWAVELSLRGRRGALATAPLWTVVAVNVINSPSPASAAFLSVAAAGLAILLIAAVHLERLGTRWQRRGLVMLPGTTSRFTVAVGGAVVLVLLAAGLVPAVTTSDVSGQLFGGGGSGGNRSGSGHAGAGGGTGIAVAYSRATIPGGALRESNTPELTYTTTNPGGAYLQMATDSVFAGGAWLPYADGQMGKIGDEVSPAGQLVRDRLAADGGVGSDTRTIVTTIHVTTDASGNNSVPFPGEPEASSVAVQVTGVAAFGSGIVSIDSATALTPVTDRVLTTTGTVSTATATQLRAAGTGYPEFIRYGGFLDMPEDSGGGVTAIDAIARRWTSTASTPYDRAVAIEDHLRDPALFSYTLTPQLPSNGVATWPVVYFLTTTHAGYCQYFASAMGALLRAAGVPSRLVNGYGPGSVVASSPGATTPVTRRSVTSNDAHTWVEAYFPAYGWVPFEPTPPSTQGSYQPFTRGAAPAAPSVATSSTPKAAGGHGAGAGENLGVSGGNGSSRNPVIPAAEGVGIGLVGLLLLLSAWALLPRGVGGVWRRMTLAARLAGIRRDRSATYAETAARLAAALATPGSHTGLQLAGLVTGIGVSCDRLTYGPVAARREDVAELVGTWRRVARGLPGAAVGALRRRRATP